MQADGRPTADIDLERPSPARIYDYWLGGAHNFAADRRVAEQVVSVFPAITTIAQVNRAFLRRAVQYLVDGGMRQFLDIGSGIPTAGHVHEIAQATEPDAKVVYVDIDPVAVTHSRQILDGNPHATAIQADLHEPERILGHVEVSRLLDFDQPIAVLMVALLHFVPDADDPIGLIDRILGPLAPGSHLVVSHATDEGPGDAKAGQDVYRGSGIELVFRTRDEVEALFAGCDIIPPGVVWAPLWHPDSQDDLLLDDPAACNGYAGVGRKR